MASPQPCGLTSRSLALLLLAGTSCVLLLALSRCSSGAPGGCPKAQLATVNGALQVRASRLLPASLMPQCGRRGLHSKQSAAIVTSGTQTFTAKSWSACVERASHVAEASEKGRRPAGVARGGQPRWLTTELPRRSRQPCVHAVSSFGPC